MYTYLSIKEIALQLQKTHTSL